MIFSTPIAKAAVVSTAAILLSNVNLDVALVAILGAISINLAKTLSNFRTLDFYCWIFFVLIILQLAWVLIATLSHFSGLPTVNLTPIRSLVLGDSSHTGRAALVGCVALLFLISAIPIIKNKTAVTAFHDFSSKVYLSASFVAVIVTLYVNQGFSDVILTGGYSGHVSLINYWSGSIVIFCVAVATLLIGFRHHFYFRMLVLTTITLWWLSHGNRSEVLALFLLLGLVIFYKVRRFEFMRPRHWTLLALVFIAAFVIFDFIGQKRVGGSYELERVSRLISMEPDLRVQTFGSSYYSVVAGVSLVAEQGTCGGCSLIGELKNTIPSFIPTPWERSPDVSVLLQSRQVMGGAGLWGEMYINGGMFAVFFFSLFFATLLRRLIINARGSALSAMALLSIVVYSQRFVLYGFSYLYNLLVFLLCIAIIHRVLKLNVKKRIDFPYGSSR